MAVTRGKTIPYVDDTTRKNVMTEFSNVYSTYSTNEMFGYRSSRRVSNLQ